MDLKDQWHTIHTDHMRVVLGKLEDCDLEDSDSSDLESDIELE